MEVLLDTYCKIEVMLHWLILLSVFFCACSATSQNVSSIDGIIDACYFYLESHLCRGHKWGKYFHFYRPALEKYSADQWLWDSGSHMIVWSHKNITNSILDMRSLLHMQQEDGRIPEEIFWSERSLKQDAEILLQYSSTKFTDTTQMPVLPYSLLSMFNNGGHLRFEIVKEFLYPLVNYFKWWRANRDLGDGLVVIIHNWESGLDASPAYDPAFHTYVTTLNDTALHSLYPKFIELVESYKFLYHWNISEILHRSTSADRLKRWDNWFVVKDVAVNAVYASGWWVLSELALKIGDQDTAKYCKDEYDISKSAIIKKMYMQDLRRFQTLFVDWDGIEKVSKANTIQNLFPILLPDLPKSMVDEIVNAIRDPEQFATPFSLPTVARNDPQFSATFDVDLMWRGPVWGFTNWFIMEGLERHRYYDVRHELYEKWISLVQQSGIYEHYNPITGEAYGPEGLGMSTLICDWIYRENQGK